MMPLRTGNYTCLPVMVSSELCKKRRINQDFPTMRDSICDKKRENLAYLWRDPSSPSSSFRTPPLNRMRLSCARHEFWCLWVKEDFILSTPEQHLLEPGALTSHPQCAFWAAAWLSFLTLQTASNRQDSSMMTAKILSGPGHQLSSSETASSNSLDMFIQK